MWTCLDKDILSERLLAEWCLTGKFKNEIRQSRWERWYMPKKEKERKRMNWNWRFSNKLQIRPKGKKKDQNELRYREGKHEGKHKTSDRIVSPTPLILSRQIDIVLPFFVYWYFVFRSAFLDIIVRSPPHNLFFCLISLFFLLPPIVYFCNKVALNFNIRGCVLFLSLRCSFVYSIFYGFWKSLPFPLVQRNISNPEDLFLFF